MKDNEIIKALECCVTTGASCKDCPAFTKVDRSNCKKFFKGAIDLIKRKDAEIDILIRKKETLRDEIAEQQAEIERLRDLLHESTEDNNRWVCDCIQMQKDMEKLKSEAYKEFAERFKEKAEKTIWISSGQFVAKDYKISREDFDNLLTELTKGDEGR